MSNILINMYNTHKHIKARWTNISSMHLASPSASALLQLPRIDMQMCIIICYLIRCPLPTLPLRQLTSQPSQLLFAIVPFSISFTKQTNNWISFMIPLFSSCSFFYFFIIFPPFIEMHLWPLLSYFSIIYIKEFRSNIHFSFDFWSFDEY